MVIASEFYFPSSDGRTLIHVNQWTPWAAPSPGWCRSPTAWRSTAPATSPSPASSAATASPWWPTTTWATASPWWRAAPWSTSEMRTAGATRWRTWRRLRRRTAKVFPGVPYFLFGHSMGSFLSRTHLIRYPGRLDGCVLCGTGHMSPALIAGGKLIADREIRRLGRKAYSAKATTGLRRLQQALRPQPDQVRLDLRQRGQRGRLHRRSPLRRDTTLGLFPGYAGRPGDHHKAGQHREMDKDLPVLFIAGDQDPVGEMGKGVRRAYQAFRKAGVRDVSIKLYHGLRMRSSTRPAAGTSIRTCWTGWRPGPKGRTKPAAPCRDTMPKPGR